MVSVTPNGRAGCRAGASARRLESRVRGCGGIGRRARFRSVCLSGRGGSSPLIRMREGARRPLARGSSTGSTASTSSACVSGLTFRITLTSFPSASITNVERSTPMYVFPYVLLLDPDAVVLGRRVVGVGEQREREPELPLELHVRRLAVGADAEHDRAALLELAPGIPDPARLLRTARRVVLGVKIQYDR